MRSRFGCLALLAAGAILALATVPEPESVLINVGGRPAIHGLEPEPTTASLIPSPTPIVLYGIASWYCSEDPRRGPVSPCTAGYPDTLDIELYAAAGPALRVGDWRGRAVMVFGPAGYSVVTLVDFCRCPNWLIDLYGDAFELICGPLATDVCEVQIGT